MGFEFMEIRDSVEQSFVDMRVCVSLLDLILGYGDKISSFDFNLQQTAIEGLLLCIIKCCDSGSLSFERFLHFHKNM